MAKGESGSLSQGLPRYSRSSPNRTARSQAFWTHRLTSVATGHLQRGCVYAGRVCLMEGCPIKTLRLEGKGQDIVSPIIPAPGGRR